MDNQNPQNSSSTPPGNRPPPPPPRVPGSGQTPPNPQYQDASASPPSPQGSYGDQRPGYAPQPYSDAPASPPQPQLSDQPAQYGGYGAPPPDQPTYSYGGYGAYVAPPRSGLPTWIWFAGGGALLAIIATVVTLVLVLGNKGTAATGPIVPVVPVVPVVPGGQTPGTGLNTPGPNPSPITSGGESTPARAVEAFYSNLFAHNYDAAYALLTPDSRTQVGGVGVLRNFWENVEAAARTQGITIEVQTSNEVIQGNNATVDVTIISSVGQGGTTTTPLQKIGNGWFLTGGVIGNVQP